MAIGVEGKDGGINDRGQIEDDCLKLSKGVFANLSIVVIVLSVGASLKKECR